MLNLLIHEVDYSIVKAKISKFDNSCNKLTLSSRYVR